MSAPIIRAATEADLPAITAIYAHAVKTGTATFEIDPPDQEEMMGRFESLSAGGFPFLVAEVDGAVAGYAYAGPYRPRVAYRFTVENSVYLDPAAQSRGIGTALMRLLIARCEELGFRQMFAVIGDSENAASVALHRAAGFEMVGTARNVGMKFGRWLDTVLMQRALGEGAGTIPQ